MKEFWRSNSRFSVAFIVWSSIFYLLNLRFCWSLNEEGALLLRFKEKIVSDPYGALSNWTDELGVESPCSWFGVECSSEGYVVDLDLKDLCLRGTLAPDIGHLIHMKSLILRNNSFSGVVPEEIANLKELEFLDLGYNNFSGKLPCCHIGNNLSMAILLVDNNEFLGSTTSGIFELQMISEVQVGEDTLFKPKQQSWCNELVTSWNSRETGGVEGRMLEEVRNKRVRETPKLPPLTRKSLPPLSSRSPASLPPAPTPSPLSVQRLTPSPAPIVPSPTPSTVPSFPPSSIQIPGDKHSDRVRSSRMHHSLILTAAIGGPLLLLFVIVGIFFHQFAKVATVNPWVRGLSGQLQKEFVTEIPQLQRSELEAACEDFSNVIGSFSAFILYKGTLSTGVEVAVSSIAVASTKNWSRYLEAQFRKKIETLSRVNHKNFINLLGYCEEEEPFTRMLVFEYAPNGTLFEHLHSSAVRETEHLDWAMRLRVAMGTAYCLDHMHQLQPPLAHTNLTSSSIYLTEDYAAKVSDFVFWDEAERETNLAKNVYSFGVLLFEMITGKAPYSAGSSDYLEDWAADYLRGVQHLREIVDPTLKTYAEDQLQKIIEVIMICVEPEARQRLAISEICARLREITGIGPDEAIPRLSPLWLAELQILTEAS